jgi:hypothetical protein
MTLSKLLLSALLAASLTLSLSAQEKKEEKKAPTASELSAAEIRTADRFGDLYEEVLRQLTEAQARLKVLQEMQQKLLAEFKEFQSATITAHGLKPGEAVIDMQQRKVTPIPAAK